jgi:hypothetical protein
MLTEAISLLVGQVNQYLIQSDGAPAEGTEPLVSGNIAQVDQPAVAAELENQLVLTLVNVAEETALKNGPTAERGANGTVNYRNPPLHLNLFLLFTARYNNYGTALRRLTQVMLFLQGKRTFTLKNSPPRNPAVSPVTELSLTMDLMTLSFEEVNHLWGALGGRSFPFALYRGRLVTLLDRRFLDGGGLITEIEVSAGDTTN